MDASIKCSDEIVLSTCLGHHGQKEHHKIEEKCERWIKTKNTSSENWS